MKRKLLILVFGLLFIMSSSITIHHNSYAQDAGKKAAIEKLKREIKRLKDKREKELEEIEGKERRDREETIARYKQFLKKYKVSDKRADILFQLGNAYFEKEESIYRSAMAAYETNMAKFGKGQITTKPKEPKKVYNKTLKTFKQLKNESPYYDKIPEGLYIMGYCYKEMRDFENAYQIYTELAEKFSKTKLAFEAHFNIGEYLFEKREFVQAIEHYKKVINAPTRVNFEKAIYKLGWSYYKLGDYQNAIDKFISLLDKAGVESDLREESLTYIAICFSEFGGSDKTTRYFRSIGGRDYEKIVLHKLADTYKKSDKIEEALVTYDRFLNLYPTYYDAPQVQRNIVDCFRIVKQYKRANEEREKMITEYGKKSNWYAKNIDSKVRDKSQGLVEKSLNENGRYYNLEGEKTGKKEFYTKAIEKYNLYMKMFTNGENFYEINFLLGECYYKLGQYGKAAIEYKAVLDQSTKEQNKYEEMAAHNIILSYDEIVKKENKDSRAKSRLTSNKQKLLEGITVYEERFKDSKKVPELLFLKGRVYINVKDYNNARKYYQKTVAEFPDGKLAAKSSRMIAISYSNEKNYNEAERWFSKLLHHPKVSKKELTEAKKMIAFSINEQAVTLRKQNKNLEAAPIFKRIAEEYPQSELADLALSNAGACYEDEKMWEKAAFIYEQVAERYPKSKISISALGRAAKCHENNGKPTLAISVYERIASKYPKSKEAALGLYNAGKLSEDIKDWDRAITNYGKLREKYPKSKFTSDAAFSIGLSYEKLNNTDKAIEAFEKFGKKYLKKRPNLALEALAKAGEGYFKTNQYGKARPLFRRVLSAYDRVMEDGGSVNESYPAKSQFYLGEIKYQEFEAIELRQPKKQMKKSQNKKATLLKEMINHYAETITFAVAQWATQATYKIGLAYENFGDTWLNQELPTKRGRKRITEDQKVVMSIQIREQVPNFYNKASTYFKANMKFEREQNLKDNDWIELSKKKSMESLYKIGQVYEEIGDIFRSAPMPAGLAEEEKVEYISVLKERAFEKEDIASQVYQNAYAFAVEEKLDNRWVERVKDRLEILMPGEAGRIEAGMKKEGEEKKEIAQLIVQEGKEEEDLLENIIEKTTEDRSKWTDEDWKELKTTSIAELEKERELITSLKEENNVLQATLKDLESEIKELKRMMN